MVALPDQEAKSQQEKRTRCPTYLPVPGHVNDLGGTDADTANARGAGFDVPLGSQRRAIQRIASGCKSYPTIVADNTR